LRSLSNFRYDWAIIRASFFDSSDDSDDNYGIWRRCMTRLRAASSLINVVNIFDVNGFSSFLAIESCWNYGWRCDMTSDIMIAGNMNGNKNIG